MSVVPQFVAAHTRYFAQLREQEVLVGGQLPAPRRTWSTVPVNEWIPSAWQGALPDELIELDAMLPFMIPSDNTVFFPLGNGEFRRTPVSTASMHAERWERPLDPNLLYIGGGPIGSDYGWLYALDPNDHSMQAVIIDEPMVNMQRGPVIVPQLASSLGAFLATLRSYYEILEERRSEIATRGKIVEVYGTHLVDRVKAVDPNGFGGPGWDNWWANRTNSLFELRRNTPLLNPFSGELFWGLS